MVHIYKRYIEPKLNVLTQRYDISIQKQKKKLATLKKRYIKIENADKNMKSTKIDLFEMVLLDSLEKMHYEENQSQAIVLVTLYTIKTLLT